MKHTIIVFAILLISIFSNVWAATLNESFTGNAFPPAGWKLINGGDTNTWTRYTGTLARTGSCAMISYSTATHDDWLITPQLSPTTGDATFSFWAFNNFIQLDHCNVKLSTTSNNQADFTVTLASNIAPPNGWTQFSYSLSAYAGQTVYIAIQAISTNIGNLLLDDFAGPQLTGFDGFETNNFNSYQWNNSSSIPWTIQSTEKNFGTYAAQSGAISANSSTSLTLTQSGLLAGNISFYQKVSSEAGSDKLKFYIDDVEQGAWSGAGGWTPQSYAVTAGTHTFRWTYSKDQSVSSGSDCAWVDDIYLPPIIFGGETNPYLIYNFNQLNDVRNFLGAAHTGKYFKLMNDIDASPTSTTSWVPIGPSSNYFYGNFDGNNHTISNLRCTTYGTYHGLFGAVAASGVIKNLVLASTCYILGDTETGSIVGRNTGTVQNCRSAATINIGNAEAGGGLVGFNVATGTIIGSSFSGIITRSGGSVTCNKIGGIAGSNESGATINDCYSTGSVTGNTWCGGLVGWNASAVNRCYSTGTVTGAANSIGGLIGQHNGTITNSYSRAAVSGAQYIGGLAGNTGTSTITNSYATGTVAGGQKGGLCGSTGATITSSYWDTQTSGIATSYGGTGKTTVDMKIQSTFTGWDFTRETANGSNDYWTIWSSDNDGYPELAWKHASEFRAPVLTSPANAASSLPRSGFNLTWMPNPAGQAPVQYTLYMVLGDASHLYDSAYAGQHTYTGLTGTSFNPVTTGGITFNYAEQWYWNVVAYNATGTASPLIGMNYFILERETFATESFEVGNVENYDNIFEWTQVYGYGYSQWIASKNQTTYNRSPRTGNWNLTMYYATEYFSNGWLFHPYPLIGGVTYDVELYARQYTDMTGNALIGIYFGSSATEAAMINEITPEYLVQITNGDYQRVSGSFTPTITGTYYMGIRNRVAGLIYYMSLDDITVRAAAIPNPVTLISPANMALGQALLPTLSWTPPTTGGLISGYKVYCQASTTPITPSTLVATINTASNNYTFATPLNIDMTYYWMVVATNEHGDAVGSSVRSFNTLASTLLNETFSSSNYEFPPTNWTSYSGELSDPSVLTLPDWANWNLTYWRNTNSYPENVSAYMVFFADRKNWLVTPPLQLGGAAYQLQFDIALTDSGSSDPITSDPTGTSGVDDRFVILVGDGSTWSSANIVREWNNTDSPYVLNDIPNTGLHVSIPLDAYSGVKYIAFYGASLVVNAMNDVFVDNVHVFVPKPSDLNAFSIYGPSTGIIGSPVTYDVTVANVGTVMQSGYTVNLKSVSPALTLATLTVTTPLAAGASATHNITWTPTTPGIEYDLYAEVVLASDEVTENNRTVNIPFYSHVTGALVESFESGIPGNWTVLNADGGYEAWGLLYYSAHTGNLAAGVWSEYGIQSDDWLITPPLQLSSGTSDVISFWMSSYDAYYPEDWEVLISTTDNQPSSFTLIDSGTVVTAGYVKHTYNLDAYGNAVIYLAVRYHSFGQAFITVDDFHGPIVYQPTSLVAPNVTMTSSGSYVELNWTVVPYASEYRIYTSDNAIDWSTSYTVVAAPTHTYTFDAANVGLKFFKVVAAFEQNRVNQGVTAPAHNVKEQLDAIRERLNRKSK